MSVFHLLVESGEHDSFARVRVYHRQSILLCVVSKTPGLVRTHNDYVVLQHALDSNA